MRISDDNLKMYIDGVPDGVEPWSYAGAEAVGLKNSYLGPHNGRSKKRISRNRLPMLANSNLTKNLKKP